MDSIELSVKGWGGGEKLRTSADTEVSRDVQDNLWEVVSSFSIPFSSHIFKFTLVALELENVEISYPVERLDVIFGL